MGLVVTPYIPVDTCTIALYVIGIIVCTVSRYELHKISLIECGITLAAAVVISSVVLCG